MIGFRYHLVSLVAMFLALAAGIALGAGPLQDPVRSELSAASSDDTEALQAELDSLQRLNEFRAGYDDGTAGLVLGDRLADTSVSLLVLPGADPAVVNQLTEVLETADAQVVSTVTLSDDLVDPAKRQLAESLVQGVLDGVDGLGETESATGYELVGGALARAFLCAAPNGSIPPDNSSASIQAAFEEAKFLVVDGAVERRAQLALLVAGETPADAPDGQGLVVADLATGMDRVDIGTVVVGTTGTADDAVPAVRDSGSAVGVSTVDAVDTGTGRLVAALALAEQVAGGAGHYGPDAPDGAVPDLGG